MSFSDFFCKMIFGIWAYTICLTYHFIIKLFVKRILTNEMSNYFYIFISDNEINHTHTKKKSMNTKATVEVAIKMHSFEIAFPK